MNLRTKFAGFGVAIALTAAAAFAIQSGANANAPETSTEQTPIEQLTAKEFSDYSAEEQGEVVQSVLSNIFQYYNSSDTTRYKAQCLIDLHNTKDVSGGESKLVVLIGEELARASVVKEGVLVKDIIYGVTEANCANQNQLATPGFNRRS